MLSLGFEKSGGEVNDKLPESDIVNNDASSPLLDKETSSPSASSVVMSRTLDWPLVTSISVTRSTKIGALSFTFVIVIINSGDVEENSPSVAIIFKLYTLSPFESDGFS